MHQSNQACSIKNRCSPKTTSTARHGENVISLFFKVQGHHKSLVIEAKPVMTVKDLRTQISEQLLEQQLVNVPQSYTLCLQGKTLRNEVKTLAQSGIRAFNTLEVHGNPLLGGMQASDRSSSDQVNKRISDEELAKAARSAVRTQLDNNNELFGGSLVANEKSKKILPSQEQILREGFAQVAAEYQSLSTPVDQTLTDIKSLLSETQYFYQKLAPERQNLVALILAVTLDNDGDIRKKFDNQQSMLLDAINQSPELMLAHRLRVYTMIRCYRDECDDQKTRKELAAKLEKINLPIKDPSLTGHLLHPQTVPKKVCKDAMQSFHMSEKKRNLVDALKHSLPENAEKDVRALVHMFDSQKTFDLIIAMTPEVFRDNFLLCNKNKKVLCLLQLAESAQYPEFFQFVRSILPGKTTEKEILEGLNEAFIEASGEGTSQISSGQHGIDDPPALDQEQSETEEDTGLNGILKTLCNPDKKLEILEQTKSDQVKASWLNSLQPRSIVKMMRSLPSMDEKMEIFNLCSSHMQDTILGQSKEFERSQFLKRRLLDLTGDSRKTFEQLAQEDDESNLFVSTGNRQFRQCIPRPNNPRQWLIYETEGLLPFMKPEDTLQSKLTQQRSQLNLNKDGDKKSQSEIVLEDQSRLAFNLRKSKLFDEEDLDLRLQEFNLDEEKTTSLRHSILEGEVSKVNPMTAEPLKNFSSGNFGVSLWEVNDDVNEPFVRKQFFKTEQPFDFKDRLYANKWLDWSHFFYTGRCGEIFWFCRNQASENSKIELDLYLLEADSEKPTIHRVASESKLYTHIVEGNSGLDSSYLCGYPMPLATIIRDSPETPVIVFSYFKYGSHPSVQFFDLTEGREIMEANNSHIFLAVTPIEDKMNVWLYRDPLLMSTVVNHKGEMSRLISAAKHDSEKKFRKGYPTWYYCPIDFAGARQTESVQSLIDTKNEDVASWLESMHFKHPPFIRKACQKSGNWMYGTSQDHQRLIPFFTSGRKMTVQQIEGEAILTMSFSLQSTNKFSKTQMKIVEMTSFDKLLKEIFVDQNSVAQILKFNHNNSKQGIIHVQADSIVTIQNFDGTQKQSYKWPGTNPITASNYISPVVDIGDNQLVRVDVNLDKSELSFWKGHYSGNSQGEQEELIVVSKKIHQRQIDYIIDYPIMCHKRGYQEIALTNLADKDLAQIVLVIDGIDFICFLHQSECLAKSSIAFFGVETETGLPVIVLLMQSDNFKKRSKADELDGWSFQAITLHESYKELISRRKEIQKAFLIDTCANQTILSQKTQPLIICQTEKSMLWLQKDSFENITQNGLDSEMVPVEMILNYDRKIFYVVRDQSTQATSLVELSVVMKDGAWSHESRTIYQISGGSIVAIESDPDFSQEHPASLKSDIPASIKQKTLYVLDSLLNLIKIQFSGPNADYKIVSQKSLSHITGLQAKIEDFPPWQNISLSDSHLIHKHQVYSNETDVNFSCYNPDRYKIMRNQPGDRVRYADKYVYGTRKIGIGCNAGKKYLCMIDDPTRNNIGIIGLKAQRDLKLFCQISDELFLFKLQNDQGQSYWTLMNAKCQIQEMSATLRRILGQSAWTEVTSTRTVFNQHRLVMRKLLEVAVIDFNSKGVIVASHSLTLDNVQCARRSMLVNQRGKVVEVTYLKSGDQDNQVSLSYSKSSLGLKITNVAFLGGNDSNQHALCGNFLVVKQAKNDVLHVYDLAKMQRQQKENGSVEIDQVKISLELKTLLPANKTSFKDEVYIDSFLSLKAILGQKSNLDETVLDKAFNKVQVTYCDRACVYDLECDLFSTVEEVPAISHLCDKQRYVQNGFVLRSCTLKDSHTGNHDTCLKNMKHRYIRASATNSFYIESTKDEVTNTCDKLYGLYRTYSKADIAEMRRLQKLAREGQSPTSIDLHVLFAQFDGQSIFTIEEGNQKLYHAILENLEEQSYEFEKDSKDVDIENRNLRLLAMILLQKSSFELGEKSNEVKITSVISRAMEKTSERDLLLKIGSLCQSFSIFNLINNQAELRELLHYSTMQSMNELATCYKETNSTRQIVMIPWPRDLSNYIFRTNNCVISEQELDELLALESDDRVVRPVIVRQFDIRWMFSQGASFMELCDTLTGQSNSFYSTDFIEYLLDEFWEQDQKTIFWFSMFPYLVYLASSILFMYYSLKPEAVASEEFSLPMMLVGIFIMLLWVRELYFEVTQFWVEEDKWNKYIKSFWNWVDFIDLSLTATVVISCLSQNQDFIGLHTVRILAALACCSKFVKLFDWLRLFEDTAFYILLVSETISDIKAFMIILVITMLMFGLPIMMLSLNTDDDKELVESNFNLMPVNVLYNQYMLSLGEFNIDNFGDSPNTGLCFIFFIMATFITQLTMLNMLIAIMGDTFTRVVENQNINTIKTKLELMSDLAGVLKNKNRKANNHKEVFMYVVAPNDDDKDEGDEWEGVVNKISRENKKQISGLQSSFSKQINKMIECQEASEKREAAMDKDLKKQVMTLSRTSAAKFQDRIEQLDQKVTQKQASMEAKLTQVRGEMAQGFKSIMQHLEDRE